MNLSERIARVRKAEASNSAARLAGLPVNKDEYLLHAPVLAEALDEALRVLRMAARNLRGVADGWEAHDDDEERVWLLDTGVVSARPSVAFRAFADALDELTAQ